MLIGAPQVPHVAVAVVPMGGPTEAAAQGGLAQLRRAGISADMAFRGNVKKRMQKANASGAELAVILGEDELARGEIALKDLVAGTQETVPLHRLVTAIRARG